MTATLEVGQLLVWIMGGYVLGTTLLVVWTHFVMWRANVSLLLMMHVWAIALSYDLLIVSLLTRTGPLDFRALIYVPGLLLGAVGMTVLLHYQRKKQRHAKA